MEKFTLLKRELSDPVNIRKAILSGVFEEMAKQPEICIIGDGVRSKIAYDYPALLTKFPEKVLSTPIAEGSTVNIALGSALLGIRAIADLNYSDLSLRAVDEIVNHVAKYKYLTNGGFPVRVVVKTDLNMLGDAHSGERVESIFLRAPGLRIVVPSSPRDAKGMIKTVLTGEDPVLFLEDKTIHLTETLPDGEYTVPIHQSEIKKEGSDVTVLSYGASLHASLEASKSVDASVEVIDLKTLKPFDEHSIIKSAKKTGRIVVAEPGPKTGGIGAELSALIMEGCFDALLGPVIRVTAPDTPLAYSATLKKYHQPSVERISQSIRKALSLKGPVLKATSSIS